MPLPGERNPNRFNEDPTRPPTHVDDLGDEQTVERASRGGWRWWWIWPVIIALILWWAGWGWGGSGGCGFGNSARNTRIPAPAGSRTTETLANAGAKQPLTNAGAAAGGAKQQMMTGPDAQVLTAQNKKAYIGHAFNADNVPVEQKLSNHAMWIGGNAPMLAVVAGVGAPADVNQGEVVNAKGTVKKAPPKAKAEQAWSLSPQDASRLEHEGAYIEVSQLSIPQQ
jgi:hypothetical protein